MLNAFTFLADVRRANNIGTADGDGLLEQSLQLVGFQKLACAVDVRRFVGHRRPGVIANVSLRLLYLIFSQLLNWQMQLSRATSSKNIELLVLRHEVAILRRTTPSPDWIGRTEPCSPR